ncbi:enoyl-CoA hydratase/isomerase family protein [Granulicella tundricola]|uniref:Enoyl-CoA hydratase/isomerase n=1 Tax=Granulicella tundricola (strain ATCC BAA-1859 / DSM 23138 / MP5ACTX9) TaxID=1198114 RepID=E8X3I1_GRATM|nr:enoyl-CoA hydratase-related protein [Granulicella tundricola]ADW68172.1 Enoyl-CoA hydratase/isomerase [Granulicella tundricola MP5ACTX9]
MATVLIEDAGGVRTLTLNRPERRNALTPEMQLELIAAMEAVAKDNSVRVVVLTGAGEGFCGGLDLSVLQGMAGLSAAEYEADARRIARMFRVLYELSVPTIAAVNGHAVAGGTGLATLCDFTLAVPGAKFGYTEVRIGFVPALVSAYLTLQVGEKRARELLLTGRLFGAEEGYRLGLVTEVVAASDMAARVVELCGALVGNSPGSMARTKELLVGSNRAWLDEAIEAAVLMNGRVRETADFKEGIASFLEKRKPVWSVSDIAQVQEQATATASTNTEVLASPE